MTCRHCVLFLALSLFVSLLSGCGTYYNVSIDSLCDTEVSDLGTYVIRPEDQQLSEDDLFFKEIAHMLDPAFGSRGYKVVSDVAEADRIALVEWWEGEPEVTVETRTERRSVPVITRKGKVEYIWVDEPQLSTSTRYSAYMLIKGFALTKDGKIGQQIWRTAVRCSSGVNDFRSMLRYMMVPLSGTLGTRTGSARTFEIFVGDDGKVSVSENTNSWW